ncbi:cytochrome B6 [Synechococcus sp. UW105]|uniref:cytochrome B6 n=1 Tax=Synechococcus sp. UW105 TaxID=337067 RepID=UPI000E0E2F49|nr:cytochrome B6 [Synechococcus sp. UW105]|tara:strand:+ start:590 stop:751 length:162 start_codon:yes stop_codon:yes gene_type:complete
MAFTLAFTTAGDAADGLLFGWEIASLQKWALIYLGVSSLAFVVVWIVGYVREQ